MKRVIPKILLFFCLIPWGAALFFTIVDCIFNIMFLEWLWIPDWCMVIFDMLSYYLVELTAFALFGIFSAYICFGKPWKAVLFTALALAGSWLFPLSRYFIGHMLLTGTMYDTAMFVYFTDNLMFAQTLFLHVLLFLIAVLLTKMFFALLGKTKGDIPEKWYSLRNPLNFAALIYCSAAIILATVLFGLSGDFSFEGILPLLVEYLINIIRFFVIVFTAFRVRTALSVSKESAVQ
ncbi:MAG: hypothetical protein IJA86_05095 [Clostridia bacterium]|nr:hypothetical protein [Clostridia bacterium]